MTGALTSLLAARPFALRALHMRNRLVGTPHAPGYVEDGLPVAADADYWRRAAAGGAAMLTVGGTVVAPESTYRRPNLTQAWRREAIPGQALRAEAIRSEGAIAACQLVHLGRETLGAETWFHPVAPSAVRSPREPTRPRALTDTEIDGVVESFAVSALNAVEAGFQVIELHAAHGYLLGQFLSAATNLRSDARSPVDRLAIVARIVAAIRSGSPDTAIGIRLSTDGGAEAGTTPADLAELLPHVSAYVDYVNLTVGMRTTYVRDMATTMPPLRDDVAGLRSLVDGPLLISHGFRSPAEIERALGAGADLIGMARTLIADPQAPKKLLSGRAAEIRPCVACNEDCRAFDPVLLCSVNPDLAPRGSARRPAAPYLLQQGNRDGRRVAVVGAGPAGLECALTLGRAGVPVVVFDARGTIGGQLAVAATAPNRSGWSSLLSFYAAGIAAAEDTELRLNTTATREDLAEFDHVVLAMGSHEALPEVPGIARAFSSSDVIGGAGSGIAPGSDVVVADDGFGWWPCVSAVEAAVRAGAATVTVLTPGPAFGAALPPEARVQLLARLVGAPVDVRAFSALVAVADDRAEVKNVLSNSTWTVTADTVIAVGERRANDASSLVVAGPSVWAIGDMVVPRRAAHAIAEGRAVAERLITARTPSPV